MVMTTIVHDRTGIHVSYYETVRHKEGIIDLTFADPGDETHVKPDDTLEILGLNEDLAITSQLMVLLHHSDGTCEELPCLVA